MTSRNVDPSVINQDSGAKTKSQPIPHARRMARDDTFLDFQRLLVTEDESLDSHSNIITRLELEHRLPEGRQACERLFEDLGLQPARDDQGDRTRKQFVFQGQCLVLGDSGVGKTSLVNSLTGKPFDLEQPKTQGVKYSVVDRKWQNLDLKDLIFGNFSRFFKKSLVQLTVFGTAGNVIVQESMIMGYAREERLNFWESLTLIMACSIMFMVFSHVERSQRSEILPILLFGFCQAFAFMMSWCSFHLEPLRLIEITIGSIITLRGFVMGGFLSVMSKSYLSGVPAVGDSYYSQVSIIHAFLFIATVASLVTEVFYLFTESLKSFKFERNCQYPGQLKFNNKRPVEIIFIGRFVVSVIIGFIFFTVPMTFSPNKTMALNGVAGAVIIFCYVHLLYQPVPRILKSLQGWEQRAGFVIATIFFTCVGVVHLPDVHFIIVYLIFFCDAIYVEYFCLISALATCGNDNEGLTTFTAVCIEKAVINQSNLRNALDQKFSSLKLKILDFAGDKEYYAYHHMFLRSQALYVIVFNMAELAENSFRDINARIRQLHHWFESVCSHVPPKTPIFLVGTHKGNMNKIWMESLNGHLKKNLWDPYCDEMIKNDFNNLIFFPVENSVGQIDPGVQNLQRKLMFVAEEYKGAIGHDIPLSWIQIQDEIINLKENKKAKFCVTLDELPTVFGNSICTNWSQETLKYFHEKGLVIYLDKDKELSKWVLLKPEILVDVIIQLVTPPPQMVQERGFRRDWKLLKDKGMLTRSLLERIISKTVHENKEAIAAFLEEYDLVCPLVYKSLQMYSFEAEPRPTHFVPSMLPISTNDRTLWHDKTTDKKFYVFFKNFLPEPLFYCLLSRAHKNSKVEFPRSQPVVSRDVGKFWLSPRQPYRLKLMKDEKMIEVTVKCSNKNGMKPSDVLCQVFSMVDGICKRNFPFVKFHCGPACPSCECPGHQDEDEFMAHPVGQPSDRRLHVYNIMPGRQGDNVPFLYCVSQNFEDELKEWIP